MCRNKHCHLAGHKTGGYTDVYMDGCIYVYMAVYMDVYGYNLFDMDII